MNKINNNLSLAVAPSTLPPEDETKNKKFDTLKKVGITALVVITVIGIYYFYQSHQVKKSSLSLDDWTKEYLEGKSHADLDYSKHSPQEVLAALNKTEHELASRTYHLREEILDQSKGKLTTYEAFTSSAVGVDINEQQWHPERLELQKKIVNQKFQETLEMSKRLGDKSPSIYALRGNTASGKSRALKDNPLFNRALDYYGKPTGVINPDLIKNALKGKNGLSDDQVHRESSILTSRLLNLIAKDAPQASIVIDKRFSIKSDIDSLIKLSKEKSATLHFFDIDSSLEESCLGVLTRRAGGIDPLVPFSVVAQGFRGIRENRNDLIQKVTQDSTIGSYKLFNQNVLVAQKQSTNAFTVMPDKEAIFQEITKGGAAIQSVINTVGNKLLSSEWIKELLTNRPYLKGIEKFEGMTIKAAMDKAAGIL